nr:lytic transglycosylase domain-containing protein [Paraburkholderia franconis]
MALAASIANDAAAQTHADPRNGFAQLAHSCAPNVDVVTLAALVRTESGFNPLAIGVVGAHLAHQPASLAEALATVQVLETRGYSYSVGLSQVNNRNFAKYGETAATLFEPCRNLRAGAAILTDCFARSSRAPVDQQMALRAALSCYYSGNFTTGFRAGYVGKVVMSARMNAVRGGVEPIPVVSDAHAPPLARDKALNARVDETLNEVRSHASPANHDATTHVTPVSSTRHDAPSCSAHPLVTVCHGLSAAQIRVLCVRCLDAH